MNMQKEYRAELRVMKKAEGKINRDVRTLERNTAKAIAVMNRTLERGRKAANKELGRIHQRRAILEGRLS